MRPWAAMWACAAAVCLLASSGNSGGKRATRKDGGRGRWSLENRELTCKEHGTLALANSTRRHPAAGCHLVRVKSSVAFVSDPGMTGSPIRVHRPVSRHAANVTTGPLRALLVRDGLLRNTLTWYILYTASTRPRIACRSGLHPQAAGSSPFPHQVSTM